MRSVSDCVMKPLVSLRKFVTGRRQFSPQRKSEIITFFLLFLLNLCQAPFNILRDKVYINTTLSNFSQSFYQDRLTTNQINKCTSLDLICD